METRSGTMPQTGTFKSLHHSTVASRSFVPSRAEQMTTPAGILLGVISRVVTTRFGSIPPARVGMTTASARASAAWTTLPSPGGVSTTTMPSSRLIALVTVRTEGPSISSTPSSGSTSYHSAVEPWGSASTSSTGPRPRRAAAAARYTEVVVLPTPPLTLLTTMFIGSGPLAMGKIGPYGTGRPGGPVTAGGGRAGGAWGRGASTGRPPGATRGTRSVDRRWRRTGRGE